MPQAVPHRDNEHVVAECHAAARDGGQEGPSGPSGRATEPGSVALPLGGVEVEAGQHVSMVCVISLPPHELLRPSQPASSTATVMISGSEEACRPQSPDLKPRREQGRVGDAGACRDARAGDVALYIYYS